LKLIAHRGGRGFGTDNTLEAMEAAVRAGVRMIETDVRMTADEELILCHDPIVWGRPVSRTSLQDLKKIAPDRPLLSEVLERLAGWVTFNIEVKDASMEALATMFEAYSIEGDTLVSSFSAEFLKGFKSLFPNARIGQLYRLPYGQDKRLENAVEIGAEVVIPYYNSISEELIADAHGFSLEVYAWTVNDEKDLRKLQQWGIDGVITDRYLEFKQLLG
jgi:glycerophosphoryl diester phosphodiesterase